MFKEEWRLHKSFVGSIGSGFFPFVIFLFSLVLATTSPVVLQNIDIPTILLFLHMAAVLYGLFVGALARIGEEVMTRRFGQINMLLQLPLLQPVSFRRVMAIFYVKDALFYILYSLIPLVGGIAIAAPLAGVTYPGVALLGFTMFLTFMVGMSLSFLLSAISTRSGPAAGLVGLALLLAVAAVWPLGILAPGHVLHGLGFWYHMNPLYLGACALEALVLSILAVVAMRERFEAPQERYDAALLQTETRFAFTGDMRTLVAKEWLELRRSGALSPVFTGFLGPLFGIYIIVWIFQTGMGVPIEFNVLFYGGMVGFLGVMTYSWLTNIETNEFMNVQPVSLDQVIKAKLVLYFLLTVGISFGYVIVIALINGEMHLLVPALLVALATTVYVAGVTARLTGIWTNTMMFDAKVLGKFSGAVIPPLIIVMIASFYISSDVWLSLGVITVVSMVLLGVSKFVFASIPGKWRTESFSFVSGGS
jgi:hypothetical protein